LRSISITRPSKTECTLRSAQSFATSFGVLLEAHRDKLKPEIVWNVEKGLRLTMQEIARAERQRAEMTGRER
jgi:amidase